MGAVHVNSGGLQGVLRRDDRVPDGVLLGVAAAKPGVDVEAGTVVPVGDRLLAGDLKRAVPGHDDRTAVSGFPKAGQ